MYSTEDREKFSSMTQGLGVLWVDSLISRHEASKMEPTVHGSWPKVFLLYKTAFTKKSWKVQQSPGTF